MAGFKRAFPYRTTPSSLHFQSKHIANRQTFTGFADSLFKKTYKWTMRFKDFGFKDFIPAVLGNALRRNKGYKKYKKYPHTKKPPPKPELCQACGGQGSLIPAQDMRWFQSCQGLQNSRFIPDTEAGNKPNYKLANRFHFFLS